MRLAAVAGAAAAAPFAGAATFATHAAARRRAGKRILVLGGTNFIGPSFVEAALARGHTVSLFNRGHTEKQKGEVEGVEHLYGNRDPNKKSDDGAFQGMDALKGKSWDAVIDTSGQYRRIVKASADLLEPSVKQYIYISSISVYKDTSKVGADETAELNALPPEAVDLETMGANFEYYGGHKAACEKTVGEIFKGRSAMVRPGLIVGPRDGTDRFTYWPVRVQRGGEVLAPGTPDDPIQVIDVRDLGEWLVHLVENNTTGEFDAVGPPSGLTIGKLLEACKKVAKSDAHFTWADADFLAEQHVEGWSDMPVWVRPAGESAGFHRRRIERAPAAGLKFRPIIETVRDTLAWWPSELERRIRVTKELVEEAKKEGKEAPQLPDPGVLRAGIKAEREAEVLAAWHKKQGH
jgi:2'-hydroxyisoflavone reductase